MMTSVVPAGEGCTLLCCSVRMFWLMRFRAELTNIRFSCSLILLESFIGKHHRPPGVPDVLSRVQTLRSQTVSSRCEWSAEVISVSGVASEWKLVEFGGGGVFSVPFLKLILRFALAELLVPNQQTLTPESSSTRVWLRTLQLQIMMLDLLLLNQLYMWLTAQSSSAHQLPK